MSIQFGRWNFGGEPLDHDAFLQTSELTAKYGPDGEASCFCGNVAMLYRPFQITRESWHEAQPLVGSNGVVLTWDGRLDNREVLIPNIELKSNADATDAEIVLAAYGTWGTDCFAKLIGDWALALWDPAEHHLLLAKDFVGVRHLFYCLGKRHITWSTVIDPLVLPAENRVRISEEFIAGYLSIHPPTHLTPFVGINAVPASDYVKVTRNGVSTNTYWSFDSTNKIRYHTDGE